MKKAAGVSDIEEVVRRFETQEETAKHLQELQVDIIIVWRHTNLGFWVVSIEWLNSVKT